MGGDCDSQMCIHTPLDIRNQRFSIFLASKHRSITSLNFAAPLLRITELESKFRIDKEGVLEVKTG